MGTIRHSQSTQSIKFAVPLQYPKKGIRDGVHLLHADKHQSFYKLQLSFLNTNYQFPILNTQNRKLVIFLQYIKKKVLQLFLCSIVM